MQPDSTPDLAPTPRSGPSRDDLAALPPLVEQATGPSRDLDGRIAIALDDRPASAVNSETPLINHGRGLISLGALGQGFDAPLYSSSIDAAVALIGRVLPGWRVGVIQRDHGDVWFADVWETTAEGRPGRMADATGPTAPLALLGALLTALMETANHE